ncbi:unnamed protein product, partial [Nesidiocoris tenuis]
MEVLHYLLHTVIIIFNRVCQHFSDCHHVKGKKLEMVQLGGQPRLVSCDDGWTVVQKRKDGSVQFNRAWEEYANGFGDPA